MTNLETGLNDLEVKEQLEKFGSNTLVKTKKINPFVAFIKQFIDPMVILLIIAALISLGLAIYEHVSGHNERSEIIVSYVEPGIIFLVIFLNSMLGAYQEVKSDQAVRALAKMNETFATVKRNGKIQLIPAAELVVGDVLILNAGDVISADARLVEAYNLKVVEASLTGESLAIDKIANWEKTKDATLANNSHLIFSGTHVTNGKAIAIVEAVGEKTEIGKINSMIQEQDKSLTPLQIKLNKLSKIFGFAGVILLFVSFIIQIVLSNVVSGIWNEADVYTSALVTAISLAVAAIPEGLITFTTVLLSIGVAKMSKQKGLVKNLLAVETLGSVSIICSDKTGTLTENKMTVVDGFVNGKTFSHTTVSNDSDYASLARYLTLCNDASIHFNQTTNTFEEVGDPTETGLLRFAYGYGIKKEELLKTTPHLSALPFDSDRKMMSVLIKENGQNLMITKGAPDVILNRCLNVKRDEIELINSQFANNSYRVLAVAKKVVNKEVLDFNDENDLEFVGLIAMIDPPRANVAQSIAQAQRAGVKTVMITGDHLHTAKAIATNLGIYQNDDLAITGEDLAAMSDEELNAKVTHISVYARVNPSDKLRIVKAWQAHEKVVAMTGDGVNDAPALKASDIGCAMGITGTDVSKQAADLILVDDNFNTIVNSIKNGRKIYDKIKIVILNLLVSSLTEVLVMLIGMIAFFLAFRNHIGSEGFYIFSASQLLWINLLTHGLPAIALGLIENDTDVMSRKPYAKGESIFARGMGWNLLAQSLILSLLTLIAYSLGGLYAAKNGLSGLDFLQTASTAAFLTLGIGASLNGINLMSHKTIFNLKNSFKYWIVILAVTVSVTLILIVVLIPDLSNVFRMVGNVYIQAPMVLAIGIPLGLGLTLYNEGFKLFTFLKNKYKKA